MDVTPYVTQLREDLIAAAAAGDEETRRTATVLSSALVPAARLAIMNALSELAAEVTAALEDSVVEIRLDGGEVRVSVTGEPAAPPRPSFTKPADQRAAEDPVDMSGDISRITLRMVEQIKAQAERAAAQQGVSLNSWVAQAVQGALHGSSVRIDRESGRGGGNRLKGWVQG